MWVCQSIGAVAFISANDALKIVPIKYRSTEYEIGERQYFSVKHSDYALKVTSVKHDDIRVGDGATVMQLASNPFWKDSSTEDITTYLAAILNQITTAEYHALALEYVGDPALECGDYIKIVTSEGQINHL